MRKLYLVLAATLVALCAHAYEKMALVGAHNSWGATDVDAKYVSTGSSNVFTWKNVDWLSGEFKILCYDGNSGKNGDTWKDNWGKDSDAVNSNGTINVKQSGGNLSFNCNNAKYDITFTYTNTTATLQVKPAAAVVPYPDLTFVAGSFGWDWNNTTQKRSSTDGNYNWDVSSLTDDEFRIVEYSTSGTHWDSGKEFSLSNNTTLNPGDEKTLVANAKGNLKIGTGVKTIEFNYDSKKLVVKGEETPVNPPSNNFASYKLKGSDNWDNLVAMDQKDGKWSVTKTVPANYAFGFAAFNANSTSQNGWIYSAGSTEVDPASTANLGKAMNVVVENNNNGKNFKIGTAGKYTFTLDPSAMTLTVTKEVETKNYIIWGKLTTNEWTNDAAFTSTDGVNYTIASLKVVNDNAPFGIKIKDGSDWHNGGDWTSLTTKGDTKTQTLGTTNDGKINQGEYKFELNVNTWSMTVTRLDGSENTTIDYEIHGCCFEGGNTWTQQQFTYEDGLWVAKDIELKGGEFGIRLKNKSDSENDWHTTATADKDAFANMADGASVTKTLVHTGTTNANISAGTYTFSLNPNTWALTIKKAGVFQELPVNRKYVYIALGESYKNDFGGEGAPYISFDGGERQLMEPVEHKYNYGVFRFLMQHADSYKEFKLYKNATGTEWEHTVNQHSASSNFYTYMYMIDNGDVVPSYISYADYVKLRDARWTIKLIGIGTTWPTETNNASGVNFKTLTACPSTGEDAHILDNAITVTDEQNFKLSFIDPNQYHGPGKQAYKWRRWWMTFNLGIIGPEIYGKKHTDTEEGDWGEKEKADGNGWVKYATNRAVKFNRYDTFDWRISGSGTYYVIVDQDGTNADGSKGVSALVQFKPQPTIEDANDISVNENQTIKLTAANMIGESHGSGEIHLDKAHIASATFTITPSEGVQDKLYKQKYRLMYVITQNGVELARFEGDKEASKYELSLPGLAPGAGQQIEVQAYYFDAGDEHATGSLANVTYFRSMTESASVTGSNTKTVDFTGDDPTDLKLVYYATGNLDAGLVNWFALASFHFEAEITGGSNMSEGNSELSQQKLDFYADYDSNEGTIVVDENHHAVKAHDGIDGQCDGADTKYCPWSEGQDYCESNNWSLLAAKAKRFDLSIPLPEFENYSVEEFAAATKPDLNVTVYGKIPYMVTNEGMTVKYFKKKNPDDESENPELEEYTPAAKSAVMRRAEAAQAEASGLVFSETSKNYILAANQGGLSSIIGIQAPAQDSDATYYNLQGIEMQGTLAPGIYIRRSGSKVEKVTIR